MGLSLGERGAVTIRYQQASRRKKSRILDELCAKTSWHRSHARKALRAALAPTIVTAHSPRAVGRERISHPLPTAPFCGLS